MALFYPYYHILTIVVMIMLLMATPFHINNKGLSTFFFILWILIWCFLATVNGIVWHDRMDNIAPIWCDISSKLRMGVTFGVASSSLALNRRVYVITSGRPQITEIQRRKELAIDLFLGLGVPVLGMVLHVVVQGHRGNIIEGIGCAPSTSNVSLAYPLVLVWDPVMFLISAIYACLAFRAFLWHRRRNTIDGLFKSGYSIRKDHYLRLMCFSLFQPLYSLPLSLFILFVNIESGIRPWISWDKTHSNFNRFDLYPATVIETDPIIYATWMIDLWGAPVSGFISFLFLGLNDEQRTQYRRWFFILLRPFNMKPRSSSTNSPTVWQRLFGRSTTPFNLAPTPFKSRGATVAIQTFTVAQGSKVSIKPPDVAVIGREKVRLNDGQMMERAERGHPQEKVLMEKAVYKGAPDRRKDDKEREGCIG